MKGRDRKADLAWICEAIVHSLHRQTECYDSYEQDAKRPFGNSGGPEYDLMEQMEIKPDGCKHGVECDECVEEVLDYIRELWNEAGPALKTATVLIK